MQVLRFALPLALALLACSRSDGDDPGDDYERVEIEPAQATLNVELGGSATQAYTAWGVVDGERVDITASCRFSIDPSFGAFTEATVTVGPRGGKTTVDATCGELAGTAQLAVTLAGSVVMPGTPTEAADLFGASTPATDPERTPVLEYPLDGAVSPRNIPPVEFQWAAAGNDLFHMKLSSTFLDVDVYTTAVEAMLELPAWDAIVASAAGTDLLISIEALAQASPGVKYAAPSAKLTVSNDYIDRTAIYYWASSQGNVMSQTFGSVDEPDVVRGDCTSCHSVSRSGTRIGYSRCVGGNCSGPTTTVGFLKYDPLTSSWVEMVNANDLAMPGSYTTFAPVGNPFPTDEQALAMVTRQGGTLELRDPDTGALVPSNLAVANTTPGGSPGTRSALMPDWSPDGTRVVFASTPHPGQYIDLSDGRIAMMTYSYTNGEHVFGEPTYLVPDPITLPNGTYTNYFFPSFSPDGELVVFNAARTAWRGNPAHTPGQRLMLAHASGSWVVDLTAMNGGDADLDITWAHWAPTASNEYYWVVFSSQRDYGHRITRANTDPSCVANGVLQCKQLWLGAVAKNKLNGTLDPSAPPMWLPGQDMRADNISPYWSVPAGIE